MPEYTTNQEVRFIWNFNSQIQVCQNRAPHTHINIVFSLKDLKLIMFAYGTKLSEVRLSYDGEEYKAFINNNTSMVTIVGTIQDRRRKGYRSPISFSIDDLDHVINMVENEVSKCLGNLEH